MTVTTHHPGEVLARKLEALGVTSTELARQLHVPASRITQIVNGKRTITGDSALRLAQWFGSAPEFWVTRRARYDLEVAKTEAGHEINEMPTRLHRSAQPAQRPSEARTRGCCLMPGTNEACSRVNLDAQLKDQQRETLGKAETVFQVLAARTFKSNHVAGGATGAGFA